MSASNLDEGPLLTAEMDGEDEGEGTYSSLEPLVHICG